MAAILDALLYTFNSESSTLGYGEAIKFNFDYQSNSNIIIKKEDNSTFSIFKAGKYLVNWWVATQSGSFGTSVAFAVRYNQNNQTYFKPSASPLKTGGLSGTCVLDIKNIDLPFTFDLANVTGYSAQNNPVVVLALDTIVQASLTIVELETEGPQGPKGDTGEQGPIGKTGPRGERGATGPRGEIGPKGATGDKGPRGLTGDQGDPGKNGTPRKLSSISNSITSSANQLISITYQSPIIFNTSNVNFVLDADSISSVSAIKFEENGDITFLEAGLYDLTWYVCIEGIEQVTELAFSAIEIIDGIPNFKNPLIYCSYPQLVLGATYTQGLISVQKKTTIRIINSSTPSGNNSRGSIQLTRNIPVKGNLKIIAYTLG